MGDKITGEDLLTAIHDIESGKLVEYASQNKSKKSPILFKVVLKDLNETKIGEMWLELSKIVIKVAEELFIRNCKESPGKSKETPSKKRCLEVSHIIQAAIDLAIVSFEQGMPATQDMLHMVVFLNRILSEIPGILDNLKNSIALMCEKMFHLKYLSHDHELITFNTLIYLINKSLAPKAAKKDVKRIYALRSIIPVIVNMREVDANEVLNLYKNCVISPLYLSMLEGQKVIASMLTTADHVTEIHESIKQNLPSITVAQGYAYGKAYFEAWSFAIKNFKIYPSLKKDIEDCFQSLILCAVNARQKSIVPVLRKLLGVFHSQKKETHVSKMLYFYYQPIVERFLIDPDGLIRANTAQIFLDIFPLEDPDVKIVTTDIELTTQMLWIRSLLVDVCPIVRSAAVIGLSIAMSVNWELFPEDMLKTYFRIIVNDLSCDSSSAEVRCAVAKGFKVLLENPLTLPTLQVVLPKLKHLFHDISDPVRIAFCQLLLRVKKICAIKYYDIVPLNHLLARMEEDPVVSKAIVNLIHNSYFPKSETANIWLARCVEMIKADRGASRVFFQHICNFIDLEAICQFMVQTVRGIHCYVRNKVTSRRSGGRSNQSNKENIALRNEDPDVIEKASGLCDPQVVSGLFDAVAIMWISSHPQLEKPENKFMLKNTVHRITRCLGDLSLYYKDTPVWESVYYLSSHMPSHAIPSLASLCFLRLQALDSSAQPQDYMTLLECLCNHNESATLLMLLKEWIERGFLSQATKPPATKKRKTKGNSKDVEPNDTKHILAIKMVNAILEHRSCQKALLTKHPESLKEFLEFIDDIKRKVELNSEKAISEDDASFLTKLLYALLQISMLLHTEEKCNSVRFTEDVIQWIQEKLLKSTCMDLSMSLNKSGTRSMVQKCQQSASFQSFTLQVCKDVCKIITDMALLGYMNLKTLKFLKFGLKLLSLEQGGQFLLCVSKLLFNHISYGVYMTIEENSVSILRLVPDCFNKVIQCLNDEDFLDSVPLSDVKEIQSLLAGSLLLMQPQNSLEELVSSVTFIVIKGILNSILSSMEDWDDIEKRCEPFEKIPISKSGAFLLSTMCMKPKIMVYFLQQLQVHLVKSARDKQSWVAAYVIVFNIREIKSLTETINKEIHCLVDQMEGLLLEHHPPKDIDSDVSLPEDNSRATEDEELSFREHCLYEYKKLKDLLQKANLVT